MDGEAWSVVRFDVPDPDGVVEVVVPFADRASARAFAVSMGWDLFVVARVVAPGASRPGAVHAVGVQVL
jgi:hypothetical protein